jgi:alpha-glucosidase
VGWYDTPTLPKLDHRSLALRAAMADGEGSVVAKWLRPPFELDGWRIDVANQTGRFGAVDQNLEVAKAIRRTMAAVRPDAWLVAEHCYDAAADLRGEGWHGTMNYAGFTRPAWCFLATDPALGIMGLPNATPSLPGSLVAATMRESVASLPWRSVAASLTLLDSHDTPRFRSAVGDDTARQLAGIGLLLAYPGVPMLFAGDEVGLTGTGVDDGRKPFPWNHPERWDAALLRGVGELVRARRSSPALRAGGLRWAHTGAHTLVFLRESAEERVVVQVSRQSHEPVVLAEVALGGSRLEPLVGGTAVTATGGMLTLPGDGPAARYWRIEP